MPNEDSYRVRLKVGATDREILAAARAAEMEAVKQSDLAYRLATDALNGAMTRCQARRLMAVAS